MPDIRPTPPAMGPRPNAYAGLSLLGILVVVAIILVMYFGSFGGNKSYMQQVQQTKKDSEQLNLSLQARDLATGIAAYALTNNDRMPQTYEDMGLNQSSYVDPWGNPMRFEITDGPPREVVLISNGPDGQPGTADDQTGRAPLNF